MQQVMEFEKQRKSRRTGRHRIMTHQFEFHAFDAVQQWP